MLELKRGFTPKDDKGHKTVFTVAFEDAEEFITHMVTKFGDDKVAEYLWEGYSIKGVNASARQVEARKKDPLLAITAIMKRDFPDNSTVTHGVDKAVSDEITIAMKDKTTRDIIAQILAEKGLLPTKTSVSLK